MSWRTLSSVSCSIERTRRRTNPSAVVVAAAELQRQVTPYVGELGLVAITPHAAADWTAGKVERLPSLPLGDPPRHPDHDDR